MGAYQPVDSAALRKVDDRLDNEVAESTQSRCQLFGFDRQGMKGGVRFVISRAILIY
jgi:hypothetical protein